ncbi:MAG TPA: SMC family ATPase [Acidobacteriota bacterium]|nr:SMC family ATPase [Acidobacteriota bacterium]
MLFSWIELKNIRSYESSRIEFSTGISLLSGDIGSGKSTILQAIEFALFGLLRGDLEGQALLRHSQNKGSVTLGLNIGGNEVILHRTLTKTKNGISQETGWLSINGVQTQYSATELKSQVLQLLNYPLDLMNKSKSLIYRYTVYTSQDQMKNIIAESAPMRLQTLRILFGVDKYKIVSENTAIALKEIKEQIALCEGKESQFSQSPTLLAQSSLQVNALRQQLAEKEAELQKTLEQKTQIEQRRTILDCQLQIVQEKKELHATATAKIAQIHTQTAEATLAIQKNTQTLAAVQAKIVDLQSTLIPVPEHDVSETELQKAQQHQAVMQKDITTLSAEIAQVQMQLKEQQMLQAQRDNLQQNVQKIREQIQPLEQATQVIRTAPAQLTQITLEYEHTLQECATLQSISEQAFNKSQQLNTYDACPVCEQTIPHEHKEKISAHSNQIKARTTQDVASKKEKLSQLHTQREQLQNTIKKAQEDAAKYAMLKSRETEIQSELQKMRFVDITQLNRVLEQKQQNLQTATTILQTIQKTIAALSQNILNKNKQLEQKVLLTGLVTKRDALLARIDELNKQQSLLATQIKTLTAQVEELQVTICQFDILQEEKQALQIKFNQNTVQYLQQHEAVVQTKSELQYAVQSVSLHQTAVAELHRIQSKITQLRQTKTFLETQFLPAQEMCEQQILAAVHAQFSQLLDEWFQILLEDNTLSIRLDESFAPIITQNGYEVNVSSLSGGEQTSVALAYRLALNRVISHVITSINTKGVIILDEPTDGFSTEQLDRVRTVLQKLQIPQILIVSHEQKIESFVDRIIRITKKENVSVALTATANDELSHQYL